MIKRNGFTLMEIMLALLVITVGILSAIGLLGTSLDSTARSHNDINMVSFADMVLNYFTSVEDFNKIPTQGTVSIPGYDDADIDLTIGNTTSFNCISTGISGVPEESYTVSYQLNIQTAPERPDIKTLTLKVWPGYNTTGSPRRFYTEIYNWSKNR